MKTLKNKEVQTIGGWLTVVEDYGNGELLFSNDNIGREEDILQIVENGVIKKFCFYDLALQVALEFYQSHEPINAEFDDLLNSDPHFNYDENEFIDWIKDCVLRI